jgi:hypothetical protein
MAVKTATHSNLGGYKAQSINASIQAPTTVVVSTTGSPNVTVYTGDGTNGTNGTKYAVYEFIATGSINLSASATVDYLYIAGGGGSTYNGGGGAGGYLTGSTTLAAGSTSITVGGGGTAGASNTNGSNTVLGALTTAVGGGKSAATGASGGSGGGTTGGNPSTGGAGTAGQGYAGGNCNINSTPSGGGGAGGAAPTTYQTTFSNEGGPPAYSYITGKYEQYGRGGNGYLSNYAYTVPRVNRGDGGNGSGISNATVSAGSSGVVIIRFIVT